jgi:hypothetical protein
MKRYNRVRYLFALVVMLSLCAAAGEAGAAQLRLSWKDNSSNEQGFKIERKQGTGSFIQVAVAAQNAISYTDSTLQAGTVYCYRVRAYNAAGNSAYTNSACATASASPTTTSPLQNPAGVVKMTMGATASASPTTTSPPPPPPPPPIPSIGLFRPATGEWFLDLDGNGGWTDCKTEACLTNFGGPGDLPVVGSWGNSLKTLIGFFDSETARWYLDLNGNRVLDGCELTTCRYLFGQHGDRPVAGDWTGSGKTRIGVFRPSTGEWYLDIDGDGVLDNCTVDRCVTFGRAGDLPVAGDWTGRGITEIGVFRPSTGQWFLLTTAPTKLPGCAVSPCAYTFGTSVDLPVVGDWTGEGKTKIGVFRPGTGEWLLDFSGDGDGKSCAGQCLSLGAEGDVPVVGDWDGAGADKIGVFRPSTGEWFLDLNGNGQWDRCNVDLCLGPFGQPGDLPVVGKWM